MHNLAMTARDRQSRHRLVVALGLLVCGAVVASVALCWSVGWGWQDALDTFVVTNCLMGASFGLCGAVIAWHRPENPIGWLFLANGIGHAASALYAPLAQRLADDHAPVVAVRLVVTAFAWSWPWSIGLFLPLSLLLFPDGHLPTSRWRPVGALVLATAPLFAVEIGTAPEALRPGLPVGYLTLPAFHDWDWLWTISEVRTLVVLALAICALGVRFRRAGSEQRGQLSWLLLATIVAVVLIVPWSLVAGTPVFVLFAIPLIPVSVAVAIVRQGLFDIRFVVSRALTWLLLSLGVIATYALLVAVLDVFISARVQSSAVATVVVALLVAPVLPRLQRLVDRAMYGDRKDPVRIVSRIGAHLQREEAVSFDDVADSVRETLRLPFVEIRSGDTSLGQAGSSDGAHLTEVDLIYGRRLAGRLVIGLRPGERSLPKQDQVALEALVAPLALAVHATALSDQLRASRERLVSAREEERRRLRRELHDGVGPTLTGLALAADAAANLQALNPQRTADLLQQVRSDARAALLDVRHVVDDLRPPSLDELGLLGALQQRADQLTSGADGKRLLVTLCAARPLPVLPAALEVAAYRIATEALTNTVKHAKATRAEVRLRCGRRLDLEIVDDGPVREPWRPGVGMQAMRERTDELGGTFVAGPYADGGRVSASFPLGTT
jgi:two-component system NarL family sensor kinase